MIAHKPRLVALAVAGVAAFALTLNAGSPREPVKPPAKATAGDEKRVSVAEARERAKLLHDVYSATLDSMHHHFFRRDRAVLPARAMEDVFAAVDKKSGVGSRWIAVNTPAMSINHEPESEFEKKAASELAAGKGEYEQAEKGVYRRAGAIPLAPGCVGCHTKFGAATDTKPRFAGLVISIPVKDE